MSPLLKLAVFVAALAALLAGGALAGAALGPEPRDGEPSDEGDLGEPAHAAHSPSRASADAQHSVRGLAIAENGLRLVVADADVRPGRTETLRYRIVDEPGRAVRDYDVAHEKQMHLIVVRRDLTGFQHLHPEQARDGTWTTPLRLDDGGSYRLFADFVRNGEPFTLAGDLRVDGPADLHALPAPALSAASDGGYDVRVAPVRARPGAPAELRFAITRDGVSVRTEPYLGAGGHLVALREGDLAFLHVHPTEHGAHDTAAAPHDDTVGFAATFPTAGRYRLFLQFRHAGRVHTAAFTQEVR